MPRGITYHYVKLNTSHNIHRSILYVLYVLYVLYILHVLYILFVLLCAVHTVHGLIQNFPDWRCKNSKTHHKAYRPPSPLK